MAKKKRNSAVFEFYPTEWAKETESFTNAEKGVYIDLLCLHSVFGPLTPKMIEKATKSQSYPKVLQLFKKDDNGDFIKF
jgi:hypothetical protein